MSSKILVILALAFSSATARAQNGREVQLARLLSNENTRESAIAKIHQEGISVIPLLLSWARTPPKQVDGFEIKVGLAEAFGELRATEAIPFLISNIALQPGLSADTWMKTPEIIKSRLPAVSALIQIGPEAVAAIIRESWVGRSSEDRLAAIFVVSQVQDVPEGKAFLSTILGQANMERYWAEKGLTSKGNLE